MSTGFKTATVASADVPATQTNFPVYIDLSRLGITTQADADSVRVYADSSKTTEWAREIVSATEMHVKVPSLTSTTSIYVYWDGTSADYAVTDTYGRNAVWSDYEGVFHLNAIGNAVNSTGVTNLLATNSPTLATGKIGNGIEYNGSNQEHGSSISGATSAVPCTVQAWASSDTMSGAQSIAYFGASGSAGEQGILFLENKAWALTQNSSGNTNAEGISALSISTMYLIHGVFTTNADRRVFVNGVQDALSTVSRIPTAGSIGVIASRNQAPAQRLDGIADEVRFRGSALSANWITTEYNNQSDEAGFWGTWSDVGGATNTTNFFLMM